MIYGQFYPFLLKHYRKESSKGSHLYFIIFELRKTLIINLMFFFFFFLINYFRINPLFLSNLSTNFPSFVLIHLSFKDFIFNLELGILKTDDEKFKTND